MPALAEATNRTLGLGQVSLLLVGIPGLEAFQAWIGVLFFFMYVVALAGNATILCVVKAEPALHEPMYLFLCMLAANDLVLSTSVVPKMLQVLWRGSREIGFDACLAQMYFIHTFSIIESAILLAMSFDPLPARGMLLVIPCPVLIKRLPYCFRRVLRHTYCEHMAVVKLACADTTVNRTYGICVALSVVLLDLGLIAASYSRILQAVFRLSSREARAKALGTCAAHACTLLVTYVPALFSFLTHRIGRHVPPYIHILLASLYLLLAPTVNPLVYGAKTQQIRQRVLRLFSQGGKALVEH
ncbi:UNVERIFIED_CONTAM: hypothetical protein K2H54_073803 [Gekko kuhli]